MDLNLPVLDLLEYGVPGLAVVLLAFAYRLLSKFQSRIMDIDTSRFQSDEIFRQWSILARSMIRNSQIFMGISVVFFVGGLFLAIVAPTNQIIVSVDPAEPSHMLPVVTVQESALDLDEIGSARVDVEAGHILRVRNSVLWKKIHEERKEKEDMRDKLNLLTERDQISGEVGF